MDAPKCRLCGERHRLGPCPQHQTRKEAAVPGAKRVTIGGVPITKDGKPLYEIPPDPIVDVAAVVWNSLETDTVAPWLAPEGQCASCDKRRAQLQATMRKRRAKPIP